MRAIPADLDPRVVADIDATLDRVVRDEGVAIPWAIESGSRAWEFPSPDSDYDCRFLYVRPSADDLSIWPRRDVIDSTRLLHLLTRSSRLGVTKVLTQDLNNESDPYGPLRPTARLAP